ncbi:hypothetical protein V6N13_020285 [Hibiscus sabdariffa]
MKEGEGYERPNEGAVVKVKLIGKLQDGTVFSKKGKLKEKSCLSSRQMKSKSLMELAVVPPNSTVYYEVEMVSFIKDKESWDMNTPEKIEAAGKKKEEGNVLFKAGKYVKASKRYEKAVKYIDYDTSFSEEEKKQAKALKLDLVVKLTVACHAYEGFGVQEKALELDPDNREIKMEYKVLKEKIKEYNKKEAKFYGNMFAKMNKVEPANKSAAKEATAVTVSIDSKA